LRETKTTLTKRLAAPLLIALSLAFPVGIAAHTNEQLARTGGMKVVLIGTALTVDVKLDVLGNISLVTLAPAGTAGESGDHKVTFTSAGGAVQVDVKAKGSKLSVNAKAGTLGALVGAGTWSADVFGPGTPATVGYSVGATADGKPTLTIGAPTTTGAATAEVSPVRTSDDGNKVSGKVTFRLDGYTKKLSISVGVKKDGRASLKISLGGKDRQKLAGTIEALVGPRTWTAHLCDGTMVVLAFQVSAEGKAVFLSASPATPAVKVKEQKNGFKATFDGTRVGVSVQLKQGKDNQWTLKVAGKSGKCKSDKDKSAKEKEVKSDRKGEAAEARSPKDET
jgi:hypothetical protein